MIDIPVLLDTLLSKAYDAHASDIHIQPYPNDYRIRFRIDGVLEDHASYQLNEGIHLNARIKVLAQLDVAEKRRPQDGAFSFRTCDIRVASFPSVHGDKLVLRILDQDSSQKRLNELGLSQVLYTQIQALTSHEQGFFLVTGPTGSGKTTSVHAFLSSLNAQEKNIVTLEDPVEYTLPGVTQSQINPELGITFEAGLRALLRQDPDVMMVGEIRDAETAHVAVQAALTGHLVVSTLHTTDAPGALIRLVHMGCERFLLAAALKAVLAQRLVRKLCLVCRYEVQPTKDQQEMVKPYGQELKALYEAQGCEDCRGTGFLGRVGIFEFLPMTPSLRAAFIEGADYDQIKEQAYKEGMVPLARDALEKVRTGVISFSEWLRVAV